ncbi:MAG: hypothetical protein ABIS86_14680, partial [Streptosporangiaceae bacterium]
MTSKKHDSRVLLVRDKPSLLTRLFAQQRILIPDRLRPRLDSEDLSVVQELRCDAAVVYESTDGRVEYSAVYEVQLKKDERKLWSLPMYQATLRYRHSCPAAVV